MHELTKRLLLIGYTSPAVDLIINTYLEEKAKELGGYLDINSSGESALKLILGLSPSKEVEPECECMKHGKPGYAQGTCPACIEKSYKSKPKDSSVGEKCICDDASGNPYCKASHNLKPKDSEVCEHQYFGPNPNFNWCPLCGVLRQKPKTLAEKFLEYSKDNNYPFYIDRYYKDLANIAEQHFKESK